MRLAAGGVHPGQLHQVFLTHLHSDHVTDFNDLVTTRWAAWPVLSPLPVTGPIGTAAFAQRTIDMLSDDIGYRISHHDDLNEPPRCDVNEVAIGQAFESEGVRVAFGADRPPSCGSHTRVSRRARGKVDRARRRHGALCDARRALRRCRHLRADRRAARSHPRVPVGSVSTT